MITTNYRRIVYDSLAEKIGYAVLNASTTPVNASTNVYDIQGKMYIDIRVPESVSKITMVQIYTYDKKLLQTIYCNVEKTKEAVIRLEFKY